MVNLPVNKSVVRLIYMRPERMKNLSRLFRLSLSATLALYLGAFDFLQPLFSSSVANAQDSPFDLKKIVPFVPSPQEVVDKMIDLAGVKKGDILYDLGSGDGRIAIAAAKKGAKAIGFEIDGDLVKESRDNIRKAAVQDLAEIRQQDILTVDVSRASVVTLYLLPDVNLKLKPKLLQQLKPGSRIVSHSFDMGDWQPDNVEHIDGRTIYLWTVPANAR
jgi:SAM-dependent methyltransferase